MREYTLKLWGPFSPQFLSPPFLTCDLGDILSMAGLSNAAVSPDTQVDSSPPNPYPNVSHAMGILPASEGYALPDLPQALNCNWRCCQENGLGHLSGFLPLAGEDSVTVTAKFVETGICFQQTESMLSLK
jgi:hypothetical protein